jgi:hypothetical protein
LELFPREQQIAETVSAFQPFEMVLTKAGSLSFGGLLFAAHFFCL